MNGLFAFFQKQADQFARKICRNTVRNISQGRKNRWPAPAVPLFTEPLESRCLLSSATLTNIAAFDNTNGSVPSAIVEDSSGNIFGVAAEDAATNTGELFEVPAGTHTINVLYHFAGGADGKAPASLVIDAAGNLFGTTQTGGANGFGTLFEVPQGDTTPNTLLAFTEYGPFILAGVDSAGNVFGFGQADNTVFEVAAGNATFTPIAQVNNVNSLTLAANGTLFGTASGGVNADNSDNAGSVFDIPANSTTLATIAAFDASGASGRAPIGVAIDGNGNIFGTTASGGPGNNGTAFNILNGSDTITTIGTFNGSAGMQPVCAPALDPNGDLVGITALGGAHGYGTVFEIPSGSSTPQDVVDLTNVQFAQSDRTGFAPEQATSSHFSPAVSGREFAFNVFMSFAGATAAGKGNGVLYLLLLDAVSGGPGVGPGVFDTSNVSGNIPESVVGGATAHGSVNVTVQNTGSSAGKGNVTVQLYVSADGTLNSATPVGSPVTKKISLKAAKSTKIPVKIKSFPSVAAGTYHLVAAVTDSTGNTSSVAGPTLMIAPPFVTTVLSGLQPTPLSVAPGRKESLIFTITNSGNIAAMGTAAMAISLSSDPSGAGAQSVASVPVKVKLKAGAHGKYRAKFTIPSSLAAGSYYASVSLDVAALGDATIADGGALTATSFIIK